MFLSSLKLEGRPPKHFKLKAMIGKVSFLEVSGVLGLFQGIVGSYYSPCLVDWKKVVLLYQGVFKPGIEYIIKREVPGHFSGAGRANIFKADRDTLASLRAGGSIRPFWGVSRSLTSPSS